MADVIQKCKSANDFHGGRAVTVNRTGVISSRLSTGVDYDKTRIDAQAIENKYTTRFDDPAYYTA